MLSTVEEAIIVAFRRTLCYRSTIAFMHCSRPSRIGCGHPCIAVSCATALADCRRVEASRPSNEKFKAYPVGYFHIDIAQVQQASSTSMSLSMAPASASVQLARKTGRTSAAAPLEAVIAAVPCKIHAVLTDNRSSSLSPDGSRTARRQDM